VKISKDGGAAANIATLPTFLTDIGWIWSVSATEAQAASIDINVVDVAGAQVESNFFVINTFGHQSAALPRGVRRRATAQAGTTAQITLDASASAVNDFYNGMVLVAVGGTGAGQAPVQIQDYDGTTKIALVYIAGPPVQGKPFVVAPDVTTIFELYDGPGITPLPVTVTAGVVAASLADGSITAAKFAAGAIDATVIADGAIDAATFAAQAINSAAIATDAITAIKIATGAITAAKFAAGAIDANAIATDAITNAKIAGGALTSAEFDATAAGYIADGILSRNLLGGSFTGRTVGEALASMRNRVEFTAITASTATMTVYSTDDTTILWTGVVALAARNPVTGINPA
jgi:hypothetical protein